MCGAHAHSLSAPFIYTLKTVLLLSSILCTPVGTLKYLTIKIL